MGSLLMVRHGQASFGADDYDQLSELGQRQCRELGRYLAGRGVRPTQVLCGTLRRHAQSWAALQEGLSGVAVQARIVPALDEYDSTALVRAMPTTDLPPANTPEGFKAHFRLLRQALRAWMEGRIEPAGMPSYAAFRAGVVGVLQEMQALASGATVLMVSSGGPISTAVSHILSTPAATSIDLNMRLRNSALTETVFNDRKHELVAFNAIPHLDTAERRDWITHA